MIGINSQQWKGVFDKLDEDIVNSAAERFSSDDADEDPSQYSADSRPREYKNISRKSKRGGLFIGIGSVVAAAAITGIVLVRNLPARQEVTPLCEGASLKSASATTTAATLGIEDAAEFVSSFTVGSAGVISGIPTELSMELFNNVFYGTWSGENGLVNLCYSANSAFGDDYTCTGIESLPDGCYMGAQSGSQYDLWFVPADSAETLYIYRNVTLINGVVQYDNGTIACESTDKLVSAGTTPDEYPALGYFGKLKLAEDLGMTADALFSKVTLDTYEGSDAGEAHWFRTEKYSSPWDKVVLKEKTDVSIVMSMAFTQSDNDARTMYFDMYWFQTDDVTWKMQDVKKSRDVFAMTADDLRVTLSTGDLDIFEMYYSGTWTSDTDEIILNYSSDIFDSSNTCGGFYAGEDGWCMYKIVKSMSDDSDAYYTQVYFIPYDDPFTMYLYEPDIFGYTGRDNYLAEYTRTDSGLEELDMSHMSWLGLQRWIIDAGSTADENSLAKAVYSAFSDIGNENSNAGNYNGSGDPFEGYVIEELSTGKYRLTFQLFDQENQSQWVSVVLEKTSSEWEVLPVDGITADSDG